MIQQAAQIQQNGPQQQQQHVQQGGGSGSSTRNNSIQSGGKKKGKTFEIFWIFGIAESAFFDPASGMDVSETSSSASSTNTQVIFLR